MAVNQYKPILDLIGKYESRGDYDVVYGGIPTSLRPVKLTDMTAAQVQEWQNNVVKRGAASSAAGKYQIIRKTLSAIIAQTGINTGRKFDKATQDEMAIHLLNGRGFKRFLAGKMSADEMAIGLAKEWASLPVPYDMRGASRDLKAGQSYYSGDGLNKAHATVAEVKAALAACLDGGRGSVPAPDRSPSPSQSTGGIGMILIAIAAAVAAFLGLK